MLTETQTDIVQASADHSARLFTVLNRYPRKPKELEQFKAWHQQSPEKDNCNRVHQNAIPTHVMQMSIDDQLLAQLKRELALKQKVDQAIAQLISSGSYSSISTQFENSILFLPSAQEFYRRNLPIIREGFPQLHTHVVNAFYVPANERPYGVHNAGSIAFQKPELSLRGYGFPTSHMSFHTALTPTPLSRQPLTVFEDADVESPSTVYTYEFLNECDLTEEEAEQIDFAFYLLGKGIISQVDVPAARDFLLTKYWEKKYAKHPSQAKGYFCNLQPGQAVVFDNYRPHGDTTLPLSGEDRVTIDLRCFSKVVYPDSAFKDGASLYSKKNLSEKQRSLEFLLRVIGYQNATEFLKLVYGSRAKEVGLFEITTDLQMGFYNKTPNYLADQDLSAHYQRLEELYRKIEHTDQFTIPDSLVKDLAES